MIFYRIFLLYNEEKKNQNVIIYTKMDKKKSRMRGIK